MSWRLKRTKHPIVLAVSLAVAFVTTARADIINVPGDFPTIQEAIDAAVNGDEIVVADGVYLGPDNRDLDFNAKLITLRSENGPDNCIINCQFEGRGFFFHSGETNEARVEGFTITNAMSFSLGGGMFCIGSSPTVTNCIFSTNQAGAGGGMFNDFNSNPVLLDCIFSNNGANGDGGGMFNRDNSSPSLTNCTFNDNSAGESGGGMLNLNDSNPTLTNCNFSGNLCCEGGGMRCVASSPTLTNCGFFDNTASFGGGMDISFNSSPTVTNCTFSGNTACDGGGISISFNSSPTVTNSTFSRNTANFDGGGIFGKNATVTNSILWGNTPDQIFGSATVSYSDVQGGWKGAGANNIDADPLFVDPNNDDYHLSPGSPCIDAADNTAVPKGIDTDLDGNPRFIDDPKTKDIGQGDCPIVDMGSYEFQEGTADCCPWDIDGTGTVGASDLLSLLASWGPCKGCPADFDGDGNVGASDLLALLANWGPCP